MRESKFYRFLSPIVPKGLRPLFLKYQEVVSYVVFGALTTLVNLVIYYPLEAIIDYRAAAVIAWIGAVVFAFVVNKLFVFESHAAGAKALLYELSTFFGARLLSLALEEGVLILGVEVLGLSSSLVKLIAQVLVVVFNYFASKLVVFRKSRRGG